MSVRENFGGPQEHLHRKTLLQDAQKGRSARPQANRNRRRTLGGYVEDFDEPRTKLADFFSILLHTDNLICLLLHSNFGLRSMPRHYDRGIL